VRGAGVIDRAMELLTVTLQLYADAAKRAGRAFVRSAWALLWLFLCVPLLAAVGVVASRLGVVGGFLVGLAQAAAAGTYLATLYDALSSNRPLGPDTLRANLGRWMWEVLHVLFPLFVLDLLLSVLRIPALSIAVAVATFVLLNPVPEIVGRTRHAGVEALAEAWRFMGNNGFEWLLPQVVPVGLAVVLMPDLAVGILQLFGPRMNFIHAGDLALAGGLGSPLGWGPAFGLVAVVHLAMLFRGALFEALGTGSRRARAWQARIR
jgi:hypothetical protein